MLNESTVLAPESVPDKKNQEEFLKSLSEKDRADYLNSIIDTDPELHAVSLEIVGSLSVDTSQNTNVVTDVRISLSGAQQKQKELKEKKEQEERDRQEQIDLSQALDVNSAVADASNESLSAIDDSAAADEVIASASVGGNDSVAAPYTDDTHHDYHDDHEEDDIPSDAVSTGSSAGFASDVVDTGSSAGFAGDVVGAGSSAGFASDVVDTGSSAGFAGDVVDAGSSAGFAGGMESEPVESDDDLEKRLEGMSEEERIQYLLSIKDSDSDEFDESKKIIHGFLDDNAKGDFATKLSDAIKALNASKDSNKDSGVDPATNAPSTDSPGATNTSGVANAVGNATKPAGNKGSSAEDQYYQQSGQAQGAPQTIHSIFAPRQAARPKPVSEPVLEPNPDYNKKFDATDMVGDLADIHGQPINYVGDFGRYVDAFFAGNAAKVHDKDSSVPYFGQVLPSGHLSFAVEQGKRLDERLRQQGISPLNASAADQEVLKRAESARRENQLQALARSEYAMNDSEKKLLDSIDRFRKGALVNALPDMMSAQSSEDIKKAFDDAMDAGKIKPENFKRELVEVGKNFLDYSKSVEHHAGNLVKDGQENNARDIVAEFGKKSSTINKNGFLDEISNKEFGKKQEEVNKKLMESITKMINDLVGRFSRSPAPS